MSYRTHIQIYAARKLVGLVSWTIDVAYDYDQIRGRHNFVRVWNRVTARPGNRILKVALRIDRDAAVDSMIKAGWWG